MSRYFDDGVPTDSTVPWPGLRLKDMLEYKLPWLAGPLADRAMKRTMLNDAARSSLRDQDPQGAGFSDRARKRRVKEKIKG